MNSINKIRAGSVLNIFTGKKDVNQTNTGGLYTFFSCSPQTFKSDEYIADDEAIIIAGNGSYTGTVRYFKGKFDLYQRAYGLTVKDELKNKYDARYIYYFFKTYFESEFMGGSRGSSIPYIVRGDIENFLLPDCSIVEQKKIAEIFSSLDEKIELNRKMNKTLEEIGQALFKHWFIDNPEKEKWPIGKLEDLFDVTMGQSPPGSSYNENREGTLFYQGRAEFGWRFPSPRLYTTDPKRFAKSGDVLLSVRAPVGDINQATEDCCIGRGLAAIAEKDRLLSFGYQFTQSVRSRFQDFNSEGTVFGAINGVQLKKLPVFLPPVKLRQEFEKIVAPNDQLVLNNNEQIKTLTQIRNSLLPRLMSGRL